MAKAGGAADAAVDGRYGTDPADSGAALAREPLAGRVFDPHGEERRFSGWLGLIAGIDTVRAAGGRPQEHVRGTGR